MDTNFVAPATIWAASICIFSNSLQLSLTYMVQLSLTTLEYSIKGL